MTKPKSKTKTISESPTNSSRGNQVDGLPPASSMRALRGKSLQCHSAKSGLLQFLVRRTLECRFSYLFRAGPGQHAICVHGVWATLCFWGGKVNSGFFSRSLSLDGDELLDDTRGSLECYSRIVEVECRVMCVRRSPKAVGFSLWQAW